MRMCCSKDMIHSFISYVTTVYHIIIYYRIIVHTTTIHLVLFFLSRLFSHMIMELNCQCLCMYVCVVVHTGMLQLAGAL